MAHEAHSAFYEALAARGVTRRDFLKFCGATAAMLGLAETAAPAMASALEAAALQPRLPLIWLNGGACTGCTESVAQAETPDVASIVLDLLSTEAFETIQAASGEQAEAALEKRIEEGGYVFVYEGAVMTGFDGNVLRVAGKPSLEIFEAAAANAVAILAVGACAIDGGWVKARPNEARATGVQAWLDKKKISKPVVNLPCCPTNPEWVIAMVALLLFVAEGDPDVFVEKAHLFALPYKDEVTDATVELSFPALVAGQTIHDNCPRRGHFENGEFVTEFGSKEEALGYCLYKMGCKGPQTWTQCPVTRWNRRASWCVESGAPCIGCGGLNWVDNNTPFFHRVSDMWMGEGLGNVQPGSVAAIAGGAVAAALVAHGLGMKAAGRLPGGPPMEEMKVYDRKRSGKPKGGDK